MSETLLFLDASTPFVYIASFRLENQDNSEKPPQSWVKKDELIVSIPKKQVLGSQDQDQKKLKLHGDKWLFDLIRHLLSKEKIGKFDYLALGKGPGLFTSLRISHVMMRTLSLLWDSPVIHFSSLKFWHEFFDLPKEYPLVLRVNRNLYYVHRPQKSPHFLAMSWPEWMSFAQENNIEKAYIWRELWQQKSSRSKLNKEEKNIEENPEGHIDLELMDQDHSKNKKEFFPSVLRTPDISSLTVGIEQLLPEYGHRVISSEGISKNL